MCLILGKTVGVLSITRYFWFQLIDSGFAKPFAKRKIRLRGGGGGAEGMDTLAKMLKRDKLNLGLKFFETKSNQQGLSDSFFFVTDCRKASPYPSGRLLRQ